MPFLCLSVLVSITGMISIALPPRSTILGSYMSVECSSGTGGFSHLSPGGLVRNLHRNRTNRKVERELRNQLTWSWRTRSSKVCSWQAGDPGEPVFQFESIERKRLMPQLQEIRQEVRLFVPFRSSSDWMGPHSHWGEQSALLHLLIEM